MIPRSHRNRYGNKTTQEGIAFMNKVGIHYAYWEKFWDTDFIRSINHAAELGFDIIELTTAPIMSMPRSRQLEIRREAERCGIEMIFCPATSPEDDLASPDPGIRGHGIETFKSNIEFASEMGSKVLSGIIYSSWHPVTPDELNDKSDYIKRSAESVSRLMPTAEKCGISYCIEIVNRYEQFMLNTVAEGVDFVKQVGSPALRLLLDTFHMNIEEDSFRGAILSAADYIGHFHTGECNRRVPGSGRLPWDEIFGALSDIGYTGAITMEPFVRMGGEVGRAIGVWRNLAFPENMDDDIKGALDFIRYKTAEHAHVS